MAAALIWEVNRTFTREATKMARFSINTDDAGLRG
jgi:hypothetical protein